MNRIKQTRLRVRLREEGRVIVRGKGMKEKTERISNRKRRTTSDDASK